MITPLTKKLFLHEYQSPYYKVKDKFLYSKVGAVKINVNGKDRYIRFYDSAV